MSKKETTVLQEVKDRMKKLQEDKQAQLDEIAAKQNEARASLEDAKKRVTAATEAMDLNAYEEAKKDELKARSALEMYGARFAQIRAQEYISEEESDKVLKSLLDYENEMAAAFKEEFNERITELKEFYTEYHNEVIEVEHTLKVWQQSIHANYRHPTTRYADGTNRSPVPVPLRITPYDGCTEAQKLIKFINELK